MVWKSGYSVQRGDYMMDIFLRTFKSQVSFYDSNRWINVVPITVKPTGYVENVIVTRLLLQAAVV